MNNTKVMDSATNNMYVTAGYADVRDDRCTRPTKLKYDREMEREGGAGTTGLSAE